MPGSGGGEILRAVMTQNAKFRASAFYSVEVVAPAVPPPVMTAIFNAKSTKFFLVLALAPYSLVNGLNLTSSTPCRFNIASAETTRKWSLDFDNSMNWGRSISYQSNLETYMMFEPDENVTVTFTNEGIVAGQILGLTFIGIEYGV